MSVEIISGTVVTCDASIKEFIIFLEENGKIEIEEGGGVTAHFIIQDLGENGLFVKDAALDKINSHIKILKAQNTFKDGIIAEIASRETL